MSEKKKPYTIRIFCKKKISGLEQLIEKLLDDTAFFDKDPELSTEGDSFTLQYEVEKSPVRIEYHDKDAYFNEKISDLLFVLNLPAQTDKKAKMRALLTEVENLVLLKIQREELTDDDDVWEFLDVLESNVATQFDGVVHTDDQIFYDKNLKKIYKL